MLNIIKIKSLLIGLTLAIGFCTPKYCVAGGCISCPVDSVEPKQQQPLGQRMVPTPGPRQQVYTVRTSLATPTAPAVAPKLTARPVASATVPTPQQQQQEKEKITQPTLPTDLTKQVKTEIRLTNLSEPQQSIPKKRNEIIYQLAQEISQIFNECGYRSQLFDHPENISSTDRSSSDNECGFNYGKPVVGICLDQKQTEAFLKKYPDLAIGKIRHTIGHELTRLFLSIASPLPDHKDTVLNLPISLNSDVDEKVLADRVGAKAAGCFLCTLGSSICLLNEHPTENSITLKSLDKMTSKKINELIDKESTPYPGLTNTQRALWLYLIARIQKNNNCICDYHKETINESFLRDVAHYEQDQRLIQAIKNGDCMSAMTALKNGASPEAQSCLGKTALMWAAHMGHVSIIQVLLKVGATSNARGKNGTTALMWAVKSGNIQAVHTLLTAKATVNAHNDYDETALMWAAHAGHAEIVSMLLNAGANVHAREENGKTALKMAAEAGHGKVVQALFNAGADVNTQDISGKTALMHAAEYGDIQMIQALLAAPRININVQDRNGHTSLLWAILENHPKAAEVLLTAGANVHINNNKGKNAFSYANNKILNHLNQRIQVDQKKAQAHQLSQQPCQSASDATTITLPSNLAAPSVTIPSTVSTTIDPFSGFTMSSLMTTIPSTSVATLLGTTNAQGAVTK
jgi:ankyrin repeat protein